MYRKNFNFFVLIITATVLFAFSNRQTFSLPPNFTGNWKLDTSKSQFGTVPIDNIPYQLKVSQNSGSLTVKRIGKLTWTETLFLDGHPFEMIMAGGNKRSVVINWDEEHKAIIETGTTRIREQDGEKEFTTIYTWHLSENGKELFVTTLYKGNSVDYEVTAVYNKE